MPEPINRPAGRTFAEAPWLGISDLRTTKMKTCIKCGERILPNVGCECDESAMESVIRCLKTAIELCQIGDKVSAQRWTERADEKLKRAMPNEKVERPCD